MSSKPFAITLDVGTSLANRTGSWRTLRPVYVNRLPPCNAKCPAGEQCQAWLYHAESGDYRHAWEKIVEDVKSRATRTQKYIIKRKMMQDRYGIEIKEI